MTGRYVPVVNPNSNEAVTRGMEAALAPLAGPGRPSVLCRTQAAVAMACGTLLVA